MPTLTITLLADGRSVVPAGTIVPRDEVEYEAVDVLMSLGLLIVDPSIRPQVQQVSRTEYGMRQLERDTMSWTLCASAGLVDVWSPTETTDFSHADIESVLRLLNHLQDRGKAVLLGRGRRSSGNRSLRRWLVCTCRLGVTT